MNTKKSNPLWSFISSPSRKRRKNMAEILHNVPIFEKLSRRELRAISDIVHQRSYEEGEFVFRKGQPGAAMFVITSGAVNIIDHDQEGAETVIATLNEGAFFGELAMLDDSPRSASARATTSTETYAFFRTDLDKLFTTASQCGLLVYRSLAEIIGARLKVTNEQLFNK